MNTAMVVDDSRTMRKVMAKWMSQLGFEVLEAEHGQDALDRLEGQSVRILLVDWNMPVMDGLELVKEVRKLRDFADTTIVMVSAENDRGRIARALMAGVDEYAMKPITFEALVDKLELVGVLEG